MTTSTRRRCRWTALAASLAAAGALPLTAFAHDLATAPSTSTTALAANGLGGLALVEEDASEWTDDLSASGLQGDAQELYLEVTLNRVATGRLARFVLHGGALHASAGTLRGLGLQWPGSADATGLLALHEIPGLQVEYDAGRQRVSLLVPAQALAHAPTRLGYTPPEVPRIDPAMRAPGLLFNYDLFAQGNTDYRTLSGWNELRLFGLGPGVWSNSMLSRMNTGSGQDTEHHTVRLDTSWQLDLPDNMVSVIVGDAFTGSLGWTRATRIGGVRVSRNFALQPYRITTPLASFAGEAALPSTVELFVNGIQQSSQQVAPGQFQLDAVPSISGFGQAQMVITDITGQSRVVSFALYNTPLLLQAGLSDWSLEAGALRRAYGQQSFAYASAPMFSGSARHGLTDYATIEAHAETSDGLRLAGAGGVWLLGTRGGVLNTAVAASQHDGTRGRLHNVGYQWNSRHFNLSLDTQRRSDGYRDVASLEGASMPLRTDRLFLGTSLPYGQIGASYLRLDYPEQPLSRLMSLSWSRQLSRFGYASLNLSRDLERSRGDSAYLYWSIPLDRRLSVSASARHTDRGESLSLEANRTVDYDRGGWGWRAQATAGDQAGAQAQVTHLGRYGQWSAGATHWHDSGSTFGYANAGGSLLLMQRRLFAMRRVDDAFAVVSTNGVADVPVKLENRLVGHTDAHGLLLLNRLNAWHRNQLSIDPLQLPADMHIEHTEMEAVPASRSGMLAAFPMRYIVSVLVGLRDSDGAWLPAGSTVRVRAPAAPGHEAPITIVGHDGMVYLQDPPAGARLTVGEGERACSVMLPAELPDRGWVELGELTCR